MSNVIKLRRGVGHVRIEHSLDNLHRLSTTEDGGVGASRQPHGEQPYVPLVDEYQRGVETGRAEAVRDLELQFQERLSMERNRVDTMLTSVRDQFLQLHGKWEQSVMQFALSLTQLILKREVSLDNEVVLTQVREAVRHLVGVERVKLRVHSRDEEILRQHRPEVLSTSDALRDIVIELDDKVEPGSCIVESDAGNVDARFSTQLNTIELLLLEQKPVKART